MSPPARTFTAIAFGAVLLCAAAAEPRDAEDGRDPDRLETKNIFGFTSGTDIGPEHDREIELETNLGFGRRTGAYNLGDHVATFEYNPTDWLEVDTRVRGSFNRIRGVDGLDDRTGVNFGGAGGKYSFVLVHRTPETPVGFTVSVAPEWLRVDDAGHTDAAFSAETRIVFDTELVPKVLYASVNAIYEPLEARDFGDPAWRRAAEFGFAAALAYRIDRALAPGLKHLVLGAELEYFRAANSLTFAGFAGDSLWFGPTLYVHLNDTIFVEAAVSTQIAGHAIGDPNPLDLVHFSRNRAQVTLGIDF